MLSLKCNYKVEQINPPCGNFSFANTSLWSALSDCRRGLSDTLTLPSNISAKSDEHDIVKVGWLVFNSTFSTKRLYRATRKLKVCVKDINLRQKVKICCFGYELRSERARKL